MALDQSWGTAYRVTATGTVAITSANAFILGFAFMGSGTGSVNIFAGTTSTATASATFLGKLVAYATAAGATVNPAVYIPYPAYCSGGITLQVPGTLDPSITLFFNPTGGA